MGFWSEAWRTRAASWTFGRVDDGSPGEPLVPGSGYLSVMVRRMHIVNSRVAFTRFAGAMHSYARLTHPTGRAAEFSTVSTPARLREIAPGDLDRVVTGAHRVLGPTPFAGGDVTLEMGLLSVRTQDMLGPYLDLLEEMSRAAGVTVTATAAPFIGPLRRGLDLLAGSPQGSRLEIGVATTFDTIVAGTYVAVAQKAVPGQRHGFTVGEDYVVLDAGRRAVNDCAHLVFTIGLDRLRADWAQLPDIASAYERLTHTVSLGLAFNQVTDDLAYFRRVVTMSPDLITDHKDQIIKSVTDMVNTALPSIGTSGGTADREVLPPLVRLSLT